MPTLQLAGAGSHYRIIPITTATAAAALTAIGFMSIGIPMDSTDVLTVYIDGLAADTTTPDCQVNFYEHDYLKPATADRTLVVDTNGLADANAVKVGPTGAGADNGTDVGANLDTTVSSRSSHDPEDVVAAFSVAGLGVVGDGATYEDVVEGSADAVWDEVSTGHRTRVKRARRCGQT